MRYLILVMLLLLPSGCALVDIGQAANREWSRDGATEQDLARERRACEHQAARSTPSGEPTVASAAAESRRFIGHGSEGLAMKARRNHAPALTAPNRSIALLYDLIRPQQQRRRNGKAERLGGFEVDDELEFRRLLDRNIRGSRASQDLVHVARGALEEIGKTGAIAHESAGRRELT
jgi:hypothetical protein